MLHKTFALLQRSLRTDVRLLRTHFFRALLLGFILFTLFTDKGLLRSGSPGLELFSWLVYCNFWFIAAAGALYFSSAISEEKEEQTLGLLRLAGISPFSLLVGKWLPRVIGGLLLVAIQFPFTLLSITLGGRADPPGHRGLLHTRRASGAVREHRVVRIGRVRPVRERCGAGLRADGGALAVFVPDRRAGVPAEPRRLHAGGMD